VNRLAIQQRGPLNIRRLANAADRRSISGRIRERAACIGERRRSFGHSESASSADMRRVSEIISPKCKTNAERTTFRANYRHFRISFAAHAFFHDRGASRVSSSFFFFSYIYIYIYSSLLSAIVGTYRSREPPINGFDCRIFGYARGIFIRADTSAPLLACRYKDRR